MTWPSVNYPAGWWRDLPAAARFAAATAVALLVWTFSSKALQDILVFGAGLFALARAGAGAAAWKQPAGIAFIVVALHLVLSLPFSEHPPSTLRDFSGFLEVLAGAFAIPVIFNTRKKIAGALFYSAVAITLTLGYDLVRLAIRFGPDLPARGHTFTPFILNHANVASMMAGAAVFVFFYCGWIWRRRPWALAGCLLGMLVCLAHMIVMASRGPQIAFALAAVCAGLLIPGRAGKLAWFAAAALAAGVLAANIEHVNPRFLEKKSMSNFSERDKVWTHTWKLARERPWFGHGYGKRNFEAIYYASRPPQSRFHYPHPHQYWLKLLFEFGGTGLILHLAAWTLLAVGLGRRIFSQPAFTDRLLPGTVALILLFIHLYGMGDYPDNIVMVAQFWLIPVALTLMARPEESGGAG